MPSLVALNSVKHYEHVQGFKVCSPAGQACSKSNFNPENLLQIHEQHSAPTSLTAPFISGAHSA